MGCTENDFFILQPLLGLFDKSSGPESSDFDSWVIGVSPLNGHHVANRVYFIDVSSFRFPDDPALLNRDLLGVVVDLFIFKGRRKIFVDDGGLLTWKAVGKDDYNNVKIWQLIRSLILKKYKDAGLPVSIFYPKELLFDHETFSSNLWVRAGCVELWAIFNYFKNKEVFLTAAVDVAVDAENSKRASSHFGVKNIAFWPRLDDRQNITNLVTNAGWYSDHEDASECLETWCLHYVDALLRGNLNHTVPDHIYTLLPFVPELKEKEFFNWNIKRFFGHLKNKRGLFVTSYSDQICDSYVTGRLQAFWRDIGFDVSVLDLVLIKAPMSVHPYTPDKNWKYTFDRILNECSEACIDRRVDLVLAACGCYALPLVNEINKRFGLDCVYYGHVMNMFFGIYAGAFKDFYLENQSDYWVWGDLSAEYPEVARIDEGRYV